MKCAVPPHLWLAYGIATAALSLSPATAEQDLLDLTVDRPLTAYELEILSGLLVQNDIDELKRARGPGAPAVASLCSTDACLSSIRGAMAQADLLAERMASVQLPVSTSIPAGFGGWEGSVLLSQGTIAGRGDMLIANIAPAEAVPDLRAIPVPTLPESFAPVDGDAVQPLVTPRSLPAQLIAADLLRQGASRRSFAIRDDIPESERSAAVAQLSGAGLIAMRLDEDAEQSAALIAPLDVVTFEGAGEEGHCETDDAGNPWPFSPGDVAIVLEDNTSIMQELRLPVMRSVILIADTGIGETVVDPTTGPLAGMLAPNMAEFLNPATVFENDFGGQGSLDCPDYDGSLFLRDIYGAEGSDLNTPAVCSAGPEVEGFDSRLSPEPKLDGAVELYEPSHGSFVAMLAVGGPALVRARPEIARQIGLQVFKTTRAPAIGSTKSVRVDPADITAALRYALHREAAVLNLSMKTSDRGLQHLFASAMMMNAKTLVVTSAGNLAEELDVPDSRVFPAGLRHPNLIVVGGLADDGKRSWWPQSAWGEGHVDIAAPARGVGSVDQDGNPVCFSGTSAAAPLVSFTAGVLMSYGMLDARQAKARILEAAEPDRAIDSDKTLRGRVRNGRKLDVAAALDVFMDRITLNGAAAPLRGRIVADPTLRLIAICDSTDGDMDHANGLVDPFKLKSWHRSGTIGTFLLDTSDDTPGECELPAVSDIRFRKLGEQDVTVFALQDIETMVLSPFRSAAIDRAVANVRIGP